MSRVTMPIAFSRPDTPGTLPETPRARRASAPAARERVHELLLEPGEVREDGKLATARDIHVQFERVGLLGDVEERSQDEPGIVQRAQPGARLVVGQAVAVERALDEAERLALPFDERPVDELAVLLLGVGVGVLVEARADAREDGLHEPALLRREPQADLARARALDLALLEHQSCCIDAHRPCAWRRETSYSAFSRVPLETAALPSLCTWSISRVASTSP